MVDTISAGPQKLGQRGIAVGIGNFMEWYDFAVYGFFAVVIGKQFFGGNSPVVAVLSALAVFAVGFFMRPVGGLILGPIGDKYGRRTALTISVVGMGAATGLIGFIPSYASIGIAAPALLVVLRCIQGLSAGGEWTGSSAFLLESAPAHRRGLYTSIISGSAALATLVGSFFALALNKSMSAETLASVGWRIPFWCAIPVAFVGLFLRLRLNETPVFVEVQRRRAAGVDTTKAAKKVLLPVILTICFSSVEGLGYYYLGTYVNNYLQVTTKLPAVNALFITGVGIFLYMCMTPIAGLLSDRYGRRKLNLIGTVGFVVLSVPIFLLLGTGSIALGIFGLILFGLCLSLTNVTTTVMLVELFPPATRMRAGSIGFNIALAFVAGPGPYIGAALAAAFHSAVAPAFYMVGVSLIALVVLYFRLPESRSQDIFSEEIEYTRQKPVPVSGNGSARGATEARSSESSESSESLPRP